MAALLINRNSQLSAWPEAIQLADLIHAEKKLEELGKPSDWVDQTLVMLDSWAAENGEEPFSTRLWQEALSGEPELAASERRLVEEIAALRYVLRNTFRLAMEATEVKVYLRLVDVYGTACHRLTVLLKTGRNRHERMRELLEAAMEQALKEVREELGIGD